MTKVAKYKNFSGADLRNVNADGWVFVGCKFDRADLSHSSFKASRFIFCSFDRASWEQSNLEGADFSDDEIWLTVDNDYPGVLENEERFGKWPITPPEITNRPKCTARLSSFRRSNLQSAVIRGYNLSDSDFSEADLTNSSFSYTVLNHCSFKNIRVASEVGSCSDSEMTFFGEEISLEFADFSKTNLKGIVFNKCKTLEAANFFRADLVGAKFEGKPEAPMCLYRVCFDHTRLSKSVFNNCDLDSASFVSADLRQIRFKGNSHANAAIFANSYMAGCQANDISFLAANFSGAYISTDKEDGVVPASFVKSNLISANFSDAALIGVDFDYADLTLADFDSATFTAKQKVSVQQAGNRTNSISEQDKVMLFNGVTFDKAVFRSVNLNGYRFKDCSADGVVFDKSELEGVEFFRTSLESCSFDDCYLAKAKFSPVEDDQHAIYNYSGSPISLESATFARSALNGAKFFHVNLINAEFAGADLSGVRFYNSKLIGADFKNSTLRQAVFDKSNLNSVNFEQVYFDEAKLNLVQLSAAQFLRVHGDDVTITIDDESSSTRAVSFRLHYLSGKFLMNIPGAIVEHGSFVMNSDSDVHWGEGLHCVGSLFDVNGKMSIAHGLIDNSRIDARDCSKLSIDSSTIQNSSIDGLSGYCFLLNTTLESCNLGDGWKIANFEEAKINLTNLQKGSSQQDIEKIPLEDLDSFDRDSISALRANAASMGKDKGADHFFNLEKEREIKEIQLKSMREKKGYVWSALVFLSMFIVFPASNAAIPCLSAKLINSWVGYLLAFALMGISAIFLYLSSRRFLNLLYGYGHKLKRIFISIFLIIFSFTVSFFVYHLANEKPSLSSIELFIKSFHHSVNSVVSIGYWGADAVSGPYGIMILYSNIESFMSIVAIALLVATIVRRTSGR